jgi:hypothetical protein
MHTDERVAIALEGVVKRFGNAAASSGSLAITKLSDFPAEGTLFLMDAKTFADDTEVDLTCATYRGNAYALLTAISVGGIN